MRKRTMRWLAMFLALIMVFTVLPLTAMAETTAGVRAELVTDASQLKAGDQIVIAAKDSEMALSTNQKSNNRGAAAVTKTDTTLSGGEDVQVLTLEAGTKEGTFAFHAGTSGYLYAAGQSKAQTGKSNQNYLRTDITLTDNASWEISITSGAASIVAQGENGCNTLRYNSNSKLFSCYVSGQQDIAIYKVAGQESVTAPTAKSGETALTAGGTTELPVGSTITFASTTEGATLAYSTDGGKTYTAGSTVEVTASATYTVKASAANMTDSTATFTVRAYQMTSKYVKASEIADGDQVAIYNAGNGYAVSSTLKSRYYLTPVSATVTENVLTAESMDGIVWTATVADGVYTFKQGEDKTLGVKEGTNKSGNTVYNLTVDGSGTTKWDLSACNAENNSYYLSVNGMTGSYGKVYIEYYSQYKEFSAYCTSESRLTEKDFGMQFFKLTQKKEYVDPVTPATVATPTASQASGEFTGSLTISFACETAGAEIRYSTDNGATWQAYSEALTITETTTFTVKAVKDDVESAPATFTYTLKSGETPAQGPIQDGKYVIYAPAVGKALSTSYNGYYNTATAVKLEDGKLTGYSDADVWTVTQNQDGSYTIATAAGKKLAMGDEYTSMPLDAKNAAWTITAVQGKDGLYYVDNTVRKDKYRVQYYAVKGTWSAYKGTGANFELAFYPAETVTPPTPGEGPIEDGTYVVYNPSVSKAMSAEATGTYYRVGADFTPGEATPVEADAPLVWTFTRNTDGTYAIATQDGEKLAMNDSHSSLPLEGAEAKNVAWNVVAAATDGCYYLKNAARGNYVEWYVSTKNNKTYEQFSTFGYSEENEALFALKLIPAKVKASEPTPGALEDGTYFIHSAAAQGVMRYAIGGVGGMCPVTIGEDGKVTFTGDRNGAGLYQIKRYASGGDNCYTIQLGDLYLGENKDEELTLNETRDDSCLWVIAPVEGGYTVMNKSVKYFNKPTYLEYYASRGFCMYTMKEMSDIFVMNFYSAADYVNEPQNPKGYLGVMPDTGALPTAGTYVIYNAYAESVMGPQSSDTLAPSLNPIAATIRTVDGVETVDAGNGALIFTVATEEIGGTTYYTFENNGKYLATNENTKGEDGKINNEENLFLQANLTDYCKWTLEETEGGYVIYNKEAKYGSQRVCIEFFSGAFSGWTFKGGSLFAMRFYPVTDTYGTGYVINPKVQFTTEENANLGLDFTVDFTLDDLGTIKTTTAAVSFDGGAAKNYAVALNGYRGSVLIPKADLIGHTSLTITVNVTSKQTETKNATYSGSKTYEILDEPVITAVSPAALTQIGAGETPTISVDFVNAGENPTVTMSVNGKAVTPTVTNGRAAATPAALDEGTVSVTVTVTRADGKSASKTWSFFYGVGARVPFFGQIHAHTAEYSDGSGTLTDAYEYARGADHVDYMIVTDHSNYFDTTSNATTSTMFDASGVTKWQQALATASNYADSTKTDGSGKKFVGAYGYEMTWSGGPGHINTFNSSGIVSRNEASLNNKTNYAGMLAYYDLMIAANNQQKRQITSQPIISQFNHPGTTFGNFGDYTGWTAERDEIMNLIEVGNGEGKVGGSGYFPSYDEYDLALSKGWHVAPTNNQDNHKGRWGNANTCRTVVLAESLTLENIYDALSRRYVYSTEDNNLSIIYTMADAEGNTLAMQGDVLAGHEADEKVTLNVTVSDANNEQIGKIEIIGESGKVLATSEKITDNTYSWTVTVDNTSAYYYVRVTQADLDLAVTAPIWVNAVAATRVTAKAEITDAASTAGDGKATVNVADLLTAKLTNTGADSLTVNSYTISIDGTVVETKTVNKTVNGGEELTYTYNWTPTTGGTHAVHVAFSITQGENTITVSDSKSIYVKDENYGKAVPIATAKAGKELEEFTVEGILTANTSGYDKDTAFFDCTYVQDATGGINIFPVSGNFRLGQKVRVHGAITYYCGEIELNLSEDYGGYIEIIDENINPVAPAQVSCKDAMADENIGLLMQVSGTITRVQEAAGVVDRIYVDDGSGAEAMFYINGYILNSQTKSTGFTGDAPAVGAKITGIGIGSRDADEESGGTLRRLRVRDRAELVITANGDKPKPDPIPVTPVPTPVGKPASNSTNTEGGAELPFRDVTRNNWFFDDVKYVYSQGIMDGVGAEQFAPNEPLTRGMIVTILYRMEKTPAVSAAASFTDVPGGKWYSNAVAWAAEKQIVNGYGDGRFGPNDPVTREQLAAILFRYAVYQGMQAVTLEENLVPYADAAQIASYAIANMNWAVGRGLLNGSNGQLMPKAHATRAQVAAIIHRYLTK